MEVHVFGNDTNFNSAIKNNKDPEIMSFGDNEWGKVKRGQTVNVKSNFQKKERASGNSSMLNKTLKVQKRV